VGGGGGRFKEERPGRGEGGREAYPRAVKVQSMPGRRPVKARSTTGQSPVKPPVKRGSPVVRVARDPQRLLHQALCLEEARDRVVLVLGGCGRF
jgi:hypothetical protein